MIFVPVPFGRDDQLKVTDDGPNDNKLILNLTTEQWTFGPTLGKIPNRGFGEQEDIFLGGLPYLQTVQNVTNVDSGKGDKVKDINEADGIHLEPGVWLTVPAAKTFHEGEALERGSVVRMASIPHGTIINAQGLIPKPNVSADTPLGGVKMGPVFGELDTTPFKIGNPKSRVRDVFHSMNADRPNELRSPKNLSKFIAANTITTDIIKNPNLVLAKAIENQDIRETIVFEVATGHPTAPLNGGGTANISFLAGKQKKVDGIITAQAPGPKDRPNAHAESMTNNWWIETVMYDVTVPPMRGGATVLLKPTMPKNKDGNESTAPTPEFAITAPPGGVKEMKTIKVPGIQIQYSQTVNLNFGPKNNVLTWPHVSVATLVPTGPQPFQMRAWVKVRASLCFVVGL